MAGFRSSLPHPDPGQPLRRYRCVDRRAGDRGMTEELLDQPHVDTIVDQRVAGTMPKHVRMDRVAQPGSHASLADDVLPRVDRQGIDAIRPGSCLCRLRATRSWIE